MFEKRIQGFSPIGTAKGEDGRVVARDLFIGIEDRVFAITVATPTHISRIREMNMGIVDAELKVDENIFPITEEVIVAFDKVSDALNKTPIGILKPFLREQVIDEEE